MSKNQKVLVIIDPQGGFCKVVPKDQQQVIHDGELFVPGADKDMERLAGFVDKAGHLFNSIHVTMDSHHAWHIAHPCWFVDDSGNNPEPFTIMSIKKGEIFGFNIFTNANSGPYRPKIMSQRQWTIDYLNKLQSSQRYPHMIWPPHCQIGTPSHAIVEPLMTALMKWEKKHIRSVNFVTKGSNIRTEHFGIVQAEVPDPLDPTTLLNQEFINLIGNPDISQVFVAGEALSHCVANSVTDIANTFGDDSFIKKVVLIRDCTSNVPGCEAMGDTFVTTMVARGMTTTNTVDFFRKI